MSNIKNYLSLIKFSHTIFALPFAMVGFFLAVHSSGLKFEFKTFGLVLLCMVFARSAAMAFNRYIDRFIDEKNQRTIVREIPAGIIKPSNALAFVVLNSVLFVMCTWFINKLCFFLSPVALLVILGYSYTKRYTALCHLVLGLGLSLAPIGAYIAVTGEFAVLPVLYSLVVLFWVSGFDIIYALQDEDFDRSQNLNSIPVLMGRKRALYTARFLHILAEFFMICAAVVGEFNYIHWIGVIIFLLLLTYQHTLVKENDLSKVNLAFFTTNGIASVVFGTFFILSLYL